MSKEQVGMLVMLLGLLGTVLTAGIRIGTLTERIEALTKQQEQMNTEMRAINGQLIAWVGNHRD